jgi:type VI secretion system secreted protein Hcp
MAFDTFLKIEGPEVKGECTAKGFEGQFEIYSFSWGASNPVTIGSGSTGVSAGKVSISSFNVMKKTETASATLFSAICTGQHFDKATVTLRKATGESGGQAMFLQYIFENVMVESIQWSGSTGGDDTPTESLSFAFGKVSITYMKQGAKVGTLAVGGTASWDQTTVTK